MLPLVYCVGSPFEPTCLFWKLVHETDNNIGLSGFGTQLESRADLQGGEGSHFSLFIKTNKTQQHMRSFIALLLLSFIAIAICQTSPVAAPSNVGDGRIRTLRFFKSSGTAGVKAVARYKSGWIDRTGCNPRRCYSPSLPYSGSVLLYC